MTKIINTALLIGAVCFMLGSSDAVDPTLWVAAAVTCAVSLMIRANN